MVDAVCCWNIWTTAVCGSASEREVVIGLHRIDVLWRIQEISVSSPLAFPCPFSHPHPCCVSLLKAGGNWTSLVLTQCKICTASEWKPVCSRFKSILYNDTPEIIERISLPMFPPTPTKTLKRFLPALNGHREVYTIVTRPCLYVCWVIPSLIN